MFLIGLINRSFKYMDKDMFLQLFNQSGQATLRIWEYILVSCKQKRGNNNRKCPEKGYTAYQGDTTSQLWQQIKTPRTTNTAIQENQSRCSRNFKIIKGMDKVEIDTIFAKNNTATTRGHKYKIYKKHCRTNRRKYSFPKEYQPIGMHCLKA